MKRYVLLIEIQNHMAEYSLPAYDNRKGSLDVYRETGIPGVQLRYEVRDGVWYLGSGAKVRLSSGHQELNMEPLSNGMTIRGKLNDNGLRFLITVHEADAEFSRFNKYDISRTDTILIGRRSDASIQIRNVYVSDVQAVLKRKGGKWYVQDFSRNGMYLNQERMEGMKELKAGDRLSFLGYRLLFLGDILAINQTGSIRVQFPMADFGRLGSSRMYKERPLFSRAPRRIEPLDEECIELELPPAAMERKNSRFCSFWGLH